VAEGEWVVAHEAFVKDLAIAAAGFLGVGEVAGEIAADELLAGNAGDLYGGLINVGDFAIGADGDEGVEAGLDEAAGVLGGLLLGGGIAGGGEDAEDFAAHILIDSSVVKDVDGAPRGVANREGVIFNFAHGENAEVAFAGFVWFGEIAVKLTTNEALARHAGDPDGGLVDVGDFAIGANGDERVEAGLDEAAGILSDAPLLGDVANDFGDTDYLAVVVFDRGDAKGDVKQSTILALALSFVVLDALATLDLGGNGVLFLQTFRG